MRFWILDFGFWIAMTAPTLAAQTQSAPIRFTDVTASSGIDFTMVSGDSPSTQILEVNGSGLALLDFDRDGDLDLFAANGASLADTEHGPGSRLYRNDGELKFTDVTDAAKIDVHRWAMGVAAADYDGDGFDDLFIACFGSDILLRNNGDGTFADVSQNAGIANENRWGTSAAFGDVDNDGDLDLYVTNYLVFDPLRPPPRAKYKGVDVMTGPHGLTPQHDFLYLNNGDGTFRDISEAAGITRASASFGLNVVILDLDNDGWQDIVVANDSQPGFLFHNKGSQGSGHQGIKADDQPLDASMPAASMPSFEEIGVISGIASNIDGANQAAMGIGIADVDDNGLPDKFTTVFSSDTNTLHLNVNGRLFEDRSTSFGLGMVSRPYLGWACGFFDLDLDGDEDLLMFNGHVYPEATMSSMDSEYQQTPLLFAREGKKFRRVSAETAGEWLAQRHRDRSAVFADLDNDGDIDVIVNELNGPVRVLRNDAAGDWLIVELRDERPQSKNRSALGGRITLTDAAQHAQRRWIFSGGGFQSSNPHLAHFGIAAGAPRPLTLSITWPDGFSQTIENVEPNQRLTVKRQP
jgi:hypothetical protein